MIFLFVFIGVVLATILTELEYFLTVTISLFLLVVGVQIFNVFPILSWIGEHYTETIIYTFVYMAVGIGWSFMKWFSFLIQFRDLYREHKEEFLTNKKLNPKGQVPEELREDFGKLLSRGFYNFKGNFLAEKPKASNNKSRIVSWMSLWPCSMIGTILNDPVRRVCNFLFNHFKTLYQRMSDHVFRNDVELK